MDFLEIFKAIILGIVEGLKNLLLPFYLLLYDYCRLFMVKISRVFNTTGCQYI